jgi:signal transduction histidine kinase
MDVTPATSYLRLGQFLDLERRWSGATDRAELAHRICATVAILLRTPATAIGVAAETGAYGLLAHSADWSEPLERQLALASRALDSRTVQIKSGTDSATGVFPFASGSLKGCLHVRIERPLFDGTEIAFLRFVASLAAMALDCGPSPRKLAEELQPTGAARANGDGAAATAAETDERRARRYVAMAAHDLRNPLNVVMGYADLLADGTLGELNAAQAEAVSAIARQADTLLAVVDEIIDLDRLVTGSASIVPTRFELRALFDELRTRCFHDREDAVDWPGPEAAFEFTTDRRKLFSIAQNLIDNALRHGGGNVRAHCTRRDGRLLLEVSDDGRGMPEAVKQGLVATAAGHDSELSTAGLGLYSTATWIRTLGGTIRVGDRESGGTVVTVTLPAAESTRNGRERPAPQDR